MLTEAIHDVPYIADPVEVGRGGFATVYRAMDLQANRPVAVKLLSLGADGANLKHFDRERESLARLSTHPNVVTLHRTGVTTGGVPYLVMEFASGGSLSDRLNVDGPFPWADAVRWVLPICDAVQHAHDQGIRHRDVKPQNILISAHGNPLLSDFGIAGLTAGTETITRNARLSLSYASPEQIDGRKLEDSTDVYSLGATLYTLIVGAPAFADLAGSGLLSTAKRILEEPPPALDSSIPADVRNAIAAAMAKDPANRPTIDEFRRGLARETSLEAPPRGDELPAITSMLDGPGGADGTAVFRSATDERMSTSEFGDSRHTDKAKPTAGLFKRPGRSFSLAVGALLIVAGLLTAARVGRGDDVAAGGGEPVSGAQATDAGSGEPEREAVDQNDQSTARPDRDDDGALDADDNCPDVGNPDQVNSDGDTYGDECDPDDDNDGVPDERDNCRVDANGNQENVDADELGDACDDFPDRDSDGIVDTIDSCIELPGDPDADGDGTPDKCDASPRGMVVVAALAQIDRVTILNTAYGDGEADMFGDLTVDGTKFELPEIANTRDIRPGNWSSDRVPIEPGTSLVQIRIWIRDQDACLFCKDGLVDITPEPRANALHLLVDTQTGVMDLASESWNRLDTIGILTGPADGDLSGTITQLGDDDGVHLASIDVSLTLVREPAP